MYYLKIEIIPKEGISHKNSRKKLQIVLETQCAWSYRFTVHRFILYYFKSVSRRDTRLTSCPIWDNKMCFMTL